MDAISSQQLRGILFTKYVAGVELQYLNGGSRRCNVGRGRREINLCKGWARKRMNDHFVVSGKSFLLLRSDKSLRVTHKAHEGDDKHPGRG